MLAWIERYLTYGLAVLLALALAFAGLQTLRLSWAKEAMAKHLQADADAQAAAEKAAREVEHKSVDTAATAAAAYEEGKTNAEATTTTLFADLAAARKRLRPVWICPAVGVPGASSAPVEPSPAERDREESAARIVGAAVACDAQVTALQHLYDDQRALINGKK